MRKKVTNWPFRRLWSHCRSFEIEGFLIPSDFPHGVLSSRGVIRLGRTERSSIGLHASDPPLRAFNLKRYVVAAGVCQQHGRALSILFIHVAFPPRRAALRRSFPLLVSKSGVDPAEPQGHHHKGGLYCLRYIRCLLSRGPNLQYGTYEEAWQSSQGYLNEM